VVTPSSYKEGKLYSVIPSDGSGDMSVTRATTATRVNSAGLVEIVPYNLLTYSEQFDNADWNKLGATISANATTAPNGTTTADNLIPSNGTQISWVLQNFPSVAGTTYTFSMYVKSTDFSFFQITGSSGFNTEHQNYNISNGTLASNSGVAGTITSAGNGWYRITYSLLCISTEASARFICTIQNSGTAARLDSCTGNGTKFVSVWGGQVNEGTLKDYQKTETRLNIPRLDYSNGSCPSILVEPQRTNLALRSEEFNDATWVKTNASITANSTTSPSGVVDADKVVENQLSAIHAVSASISLSVGANTLSIYAKADGRNWLCLGLLGTLNSQVWFNLSTGTIGTIQSAATASITNVGNGWYRCSITVTVIAGFNTPAFFLSNADNTISYTGNGTSGIFLWGAQLEAGSYSTSYIPTTSASVTRNADAISKTGISSLIGQTEGTLFLDLQYSNTTDIDMFLSIRPNSSNKLEIFRDGGVIYAEVVASNSISIVSTQPIGSYKIAFAYKSGSTALYINGTLISQSTTTFTFTNTLADLYLNSRGGSSFIEAANFNSVALWQTRLTNAQLAQLTTI
jgi:hypothetical protein